MHTSHNKVIHLLFKGGMQYTTKSSLTVAKVISQYALKFLELYCYFDRILYTAYSKVQNKRKTQLYLFSSFEPMRMCS